MDPNSNPQRTSGIPRLSKLPVLKSTPAASLNQSRLRPTSSVDTLRKKTSQTTLTSSTTSSTTRRVSGISSTRSASTTAKTAATAPVRKDESVFKKPIGRPPSRQAQTQTRQRTISRSNARQQEEDILGSLDGFRSSSRASSRASFRDEEQPEHATIAPPTEEAPKVKKSRPSLSDRTIESLSQIPPSPAPRRRQSKNFNGPDSPQRPPSRSSSSLGHYGKRPGTSDGGFSRSVSRTPATPSSSKIENVAFRGSMTAPGKRSMSAAMPKKSSQTLRQSTRAETTPSKPVQAPASIRGSRTLTSSAAPKPRASLNGLFDKSRTSTSTSTPVRGTPKAVLQASPQNDPESSARKVSNSSAALRDQIAKAKAARKAASAKPLADSTRTNIADAEFDFGLGDDPFNQVPKGGEAVLRKRVDAARSDGRLNISAMGLNEIPEVVMKMYDFDSNQSSSIAWGEVVDLTRFNAADNDLEEISETVFPDLDPEANSNEDLPGLQFGALEAIDLHGNILKGVPIGMRRMTQLTSLNLSRNRLNIAALAVISQISSLKELKLSDNDLHGSIPSGSIGQLSNLQSLDLQGNRLSQLPVDLHQLVNLHVLHVGGNQLSSLDMPSLLQLPIVQIHAPKNMLQGVLVAGESSISSTSLQVLNVSGNTLSSLTNGVKLELPQLQILDVSVNRMSELPDIANCGSLVTVLAGENKLQSLPEGFVELTRLKNADFSSNDIAKLDERLALMESLDSFSIAANPLRERKYLTMHTNDLKQQLRSKLAPSEVIADQATNMDVGEFGPGTLDESDLGAWKLTPSGTLDLSGTDVSQLDDARFRKFAAQHDVKQVNLQQNRLESIPHVLAIAPSLTMLNMSHNNISSLLQTNMSLPYLRDLKLAGNKLTTAALVDLQRFLSAPNLQTLDLTYNKLDGALPVMTESFPNLFALQVADNAIKTVEAKALESLRMVDLSNNSIEKLDPRIGLLAGRLTGLNVEGNTFRVPGYQVLRKGTEAILGWLRDRLPDEEREGFE